MDPGNVVASFVDLVRVWPVFWRGLLVLNSGIYVRSQPELGGTILNREIAQGNIGDEVVRALWVVVG